MEVGTQHGRYYTINASYRSVVVSFPVEVMALLEQTISVVFLLFSVILCISQSSDDLKFKEFIAKYDKHYDRQEYAYRFLVFKNTLKRIEILNKKHINDGHYGPYGVTKFADMTRAEFQSKVLKPRSSDTKDYRKRSRVTRAALLTADDILKLNLPKRVDWKVVRDAKVINPVRNQGECGACWAFSTVETLESMYAIGTKERPLLSVQQVIDCADNGNYGCQGGDTCTALAWMNNTKATIVPDSEYPFTHATGSCRMKNNLSSTKGSGVQIRRFTCDDLTTNEIKMLELLANHGPLVVAVDATMWQDYLGGIIKFHCEAMHNHAVQIVGYDITGPVPFYVVRNSWGTEFGLDGYLYIAVGKNLCGIANEVATLDAIY